MQIKKWIYFDKNEEKSKFLRLLRTSNSEIEAVQKVMSEFSLGLLDAKDAVNNFIKEIGHDLSK